MRLVLIRHGASSHTARRIIADVAGCQGLTEHGQAQALALAERLRATGELHDCSVLLCSPVARARQTAALLAGGLPVATISIDDDLRELHPGAADGLTWAEYRTRYGEFDPQAAPTRPFAPGGESWDQFLVRVQTEASGFSTRPTDRKFNPHAARKIAAGLRLRPHIAATKSVRYVVIPHTVGSTNRCVLKPDASGHAGLPERHHDPLRQQPG